MYYCETHEESVGRRPSCDDEAALDKKSPVALCMASLDNSKGVSSRSWIQADRTSVVEEDLLLMPGEPWKHTLRQKVAAPRIS